MFLEIGRLPGRTIAADVKHESRWCPVREAVTRRYVRLDTPTVIRGITLDLDAAGSHPWVWEDAGVPAPNWSAARPAQGDDLWPRRPHLRWDIEVPVLHPARGGSPRAWATFQAIVTELRRRLVADTGGPVEHVAGRMSKNPDSRAWHATQFRETPYSLTELARALDLDPADIHPAKRQSGRGLDEALASAGGRNDELFHRLRFHAYTVVGRFAGQTALQEHLTAELEAMNSALLSPLPPVEVRSISKSVSVWTWRHRDALAGPRRGAMTASFAPGLTVTEKRIAAAHRTARLNRERHGDAVAVAFDRLSRETGRRPTQAAVAAAAGVSERTVRSRWTALLAIGQDRQNGRHQGPPAGEEVKGQMILAPRPGGLMRLARLTRRLDSATADPPVEVGASSCLAPKFPAPGRLAVVAANTRRREAEGADPVVPVRSITAPIVRAPMKGLAALAARARRHEPESPPLPRHRSRRRQDRLSRPQRERDPWARYLDEHGWLRMTKAQLRAADNAPEYQVPES